LLWLAALAGGVLLVVLGLRWFAQASPRDLIIAGRTFIAAFSALASTGLLLTGRFGLALVTVAATVMAVRALRAGRRGADPTRGPEPADTSTIETLLLQMRLDRRTGAVDGEVRAGPFAGRALASLGRTDLMRLLEQARLDDPPSVAVLEAYLDRRYPDWRGAGFAHGSADPAASGPAMDEATALRVLGLSPGATHDEVKAAHRRLMARLHPDLGGSDYLASQINRAKDVLLGNRDAG
jgi:hypothetical protein